MNELIKVDENGRITARELYDFLGLNPAHFARWAATNIVCNQFAEIDSDYNRFTIHGETPTGGTIEREDFYLSIDFAKKLCMISKSERGEQARNYFIEVEKRYKAAQPLPQMTQTQIIAAIAQAAAEQEKQLKQIAATQQRHNEQLTVINHRIDSLDSCNIDGNIQQRFNAMIRKYAMDNGMLFNKAWGEFKTAFDLAFRTNLGLRISNYKEKHGLKSLTIPQYLSMTNQLEDAVRVADKMINKKAS